MYISTQYQNKLRKAVNKLEKCEDSFKGNSINFKVTIKK